MHIPGAPLTYLLTWACYGARLPGRSGYISRHQNQFNAPLPRLSSHLARSAKQAMPPATPYLLDHPRRLAVLQSIQQVADYHGWTLWAAHVRTNHVHVVISAPQTPERVAAILKAYAGRALNLITQPIIHSSHWARHASTRYLWNAISVRAAIDYVIRQQGEPMALYERLDHPA